jgi:predicted peptidase
MRRKLLLGLPLLLVMLACGRTTAAQIPTTEVQLQGSFDVPESLFGSQLVEESMRYLLWLPEGYGDDLGRDWPLIVFLHGSGDTEYGAEWVQSFGLPAVLHAQEQPENFEFVVLSPQAAGGSAWWTGNTVDVIDALVDEITTDYLVDADRIYLTGLSMGGYGSWFVAMDHHERFAAMVSTSGSGWRQPVLPAGDVCGMSDLPIRAIHDVI